MLCQTFSQFIWIVKNCLIHLWRNFFIFVDIWILVFYPYPLRNAYGNIAEWRSWQRVWLITKRHWFDSNLRNKKIFAFV